LIENPIAANQRGWEYYRILAIRRRWWLMGPFFVLGLSSFAVALLWPPRYRSEALILVEQQKVPTQYVTPNVIEDLNDRVQSMTQQILSRTRLQHVIEQFHLYPREQARLTTDEVIDKMRRDILIEPAKPPTGRESLNAFRIYYSSGNPRMAQQVNNELTSLFIEANLEERAQQSVSTTKFLVNQLEQARKDLAEQEERLRVYKTSYLGELPQQEQTNLQIVRGLEAQLYAVSDALGRAEQQKIYLESLRAEYLARRQYLGAADVSSQVPSSTVAELALRDLRKQLAEMEAKYTPRHPDVLKLRQQIDQWEALKQNVETPVTTSQKDQAHADIDIAGPASQPALIDVDSRLKAVRAEIENHHQEVEKLRKGIDAVQSRLRITPMREQQMAEVTRNYENSRQYYQSLLQKKLESELATNLEKRQQGERFRIIDPPSLPQTPHEPNRVIIILVGWVAGIFAGVGLTTLRESADDTLRSEDIGHITRFSVLARIPVLLSPREQARQKWDRTAEVAGVTLLILLSVAIGLYVCFPGRYI